MWEKENPTVSTTEDDLKIYCRFPLNDGGGNDASVLLQAVRTIVDFLDSGTRFTPICELLGFTIVRTVKLPGTS